MTEARNPAKDWLTSLTKRVFFWIFGVALGIVGLVQLVLSITHEHKARIPVLLFASLAAILIFSFLAYRDRTIDLHQEMAKVERRDTDIVGLKDDVRRITDERDSWQRMHAETSTNFQTLLATYLAATTSYAQFTQPGDSTDQPSQVDAEPPPESD